jgi:UDP-N-acetylmuramyl tripeptide synthase
MSEYAAPTIVDSRRLMGANRFHAEPGVVLEVEPAVATPQVVRGWAQHVAALWRALGWPPTEVAWLVRASCAQLFATAPVDGLMTATTASEWAWATASGVVPAVPVAEAPLAEAPLAEAPLAEAPLAEGPLAEGPLAELVAARDEERARLGAVAAAWAEAARRGLSASLDDEALHVGSGVGVAVAPLPVPAAWRPGAACRDVPITLVTGSNGKTTTTRLVAAMWRAAGRVTGWSSSDGVHRGAPTGDVVTLADGDYTGPAGARLVLRDAQVEAAVLETARGGILRRGLATTRAHVAVITNISADHFGEYGVDTLADLAAVKATEARVIAAPDGVLVLNADDTELVGFAERVWGAAARSVAAEAVRDGGAEAPIDIAPPGLPRIAWFAAPQADGAPPSAGAVARVHAGIEAHGLGAVAEQGQLRVAMDGHWHDLGAVRAMPVTLGGAAHHNVANALAAALAAVAAGVPPAAAADALGRFGADDNAGRLMVREVGGVTVVLDYAHNPDGVRALGHAVATLPATRRLLLLGQAGDRDDALLHALAESAWRALPWDRVVLKEMPEARRGRRAGDVTERLREGLLAAGAPPEAIVTCEGEEAGVREALAWARAGDLLVLTVHVDRTGALALLDRLATTGWRAGQARAREDGPPPP